MPFGVDRQDTILCQDSFSCIQSFKVRCTLFDLQSGPGPREDLHQGRGIGHFNITDEFKRKIGGMDRADRIQEVEGKLVAWIGPIESRKWK